MTQYLRRNGSGCIDLDNHVCHFKRRPMAMLNQVLKQLGRRSGISLVRRIADPSAINNRTFSIGGDADKFAIRRAA